MGEHFTHKWKVYICGPAEDADISYFVKKVRFFLHPSYKPNDVIEVHQAPFALIRWGWGEFPVRVQLHLKSSSKKTIDIIHQLLLDKSFTGSQVLGSERPYTIEIDRSILEQQPNFIHEHHMNNDNVESTSSNPTVLTTVSSHQPMIKKSYEIELDPTIDSLLSAVIDHYPLIRKGNFYERWYHIIKTCNHFYESFGDDTSSFHHVVSSANASSSLIYRCATSINEYFNWNIGRRKAVEVSYLPIYKNDSCLSSLNIDGMIFSSTFFSSNSKWLRARQLKKHLMHLDHHNISTKQLLLWCRERGYTPQKLQQSIPRNKASISSFTTLDSSSFLMKESVTIPNYCKYCGWQHKPKKDFDTTPLRKNCRYKPRKRSIDSATKADELLSNLLPICKNQDDYHPIDLGECIDDADGLICDDMDLLREENVVIPSDPHLLKWISACLQRLHIHLGIHDPKTVDRGILAGNAIIIAMKCFLSDLMKTAGQKAALMKEEENEVVDNVQQLLPTLRMLTPLHIYQAIQSKELFDFLTNQYMHR
jgi:hypothetical protein